MPILSQKQADDLSYAVIGAAIEVHKELGPGLLENIYQKCLEMEMEMRKIKFQKEMIVPISYKGVYVNADLRCDFFIEDCLVVELKAVDKMIPVYEAQVMTYMRLLKSPKGVLINFNCQNLFKYGQATYVNDTYRNLPLVNDLQ